MRKDSCVTFNSSLRCTVVKHYSEATIHKLNPSTTFMHLSIPPLPYSYFFWSCPSFKPNSSARCRLHLLESFNLEVRPYAAALLCTSSRTCMLLCPLPVFHRSTSFIFPVFFAPLTQFASQWLTLNGYAFFFCFCYSLFGDVAFSVFNTIFFVCFISAEVFTVFIGGFRGFTTRYLYTRILSGRPRVLGSWMPGFTQFWFLLLFPSPRRHRSSQIPAHILLSNSRDVFLHGILLVLNP